MDPEMHYRCQHCDQLFQSDQERPRCPRCLRMTTVVPIGAPLAPHAAPAPRPYRRSRRRAHRVPWSLSLGVALLGASAVAALLTDFREVPDGEQLGMAIGFAAGGGAGLGLALRGLWTPLRRR